MCQCAEHNFKLESSLPVTTTVEQPEESVGTMRVTVGQLDSVSQSLNPELPLKVTVMVQRPVFMTVTVPEY